jgi:hypothetical protein
MRMSSGVLPSGSSTPPRRDPAHAAAELARLEIFDQVGQDHRRTRAVEEHEFLDRPAVAEMHLVDFARPGFRWRIGKVGIERNGDLLRSRATAHAR